MTIYRVYEDKVKNYYNKINMCINGAKNSMTLA